MGADGGIITNAPTGSDIGLIALCLLGEFVVCFLLGSIPWGVIISRVFFKKDIRDEGSGNIGATNAMRSMGKKGGIPVFLLDFLKGLLAGMVGVQVGYMIAKYFNADFRTAYGIALLACTWGHIFSPWLHFKGGKGITVAFGCMFFVYGPLGALLVLLCFLVLVAVTRRISCGSIAGAVACIVLGFYYFGPLVGWPWFNWPSVIADVLTGATVIWAHRGNIKRIIEGTEPRIGDKKKATKKS